MAESDDGFFSVGDLIASRVMKRGNHPDVYPQLFTGDSDWTDWECVPENTMAVVIGRHKRPTGMGRRWHNVQLTPAGKVGWIDGPAFWERLNK